ncbi:hypothetical protein DFA_05919 [Cavenderia fasciculata]|uniref:Uncharacterized protein n=1 Tax=Cavenderia fasciculata TaxID=261658 RepID=F4PJK9_CACFS|nr:uncharacterized protein DFA_05919 [Cavenderia fasciculata]EGG23783.1 hypothetical protein DFA_05919 [Cavenderia fasciculata]|eukprot:XP_004361634.1 hypothetical protein DFA_05919 [Cavenderia fasciculata]
MEEENNKKKNKDLPFIIQLKIINYVLWSRCISNSFESDYIYLDKDNYQLARVNKKWFQQVSGSVTGIDLGTIASLRPLVQNGPYLTKGRLLFLKLLFINTKSNEYSIVKQLKSMTIHQLNYFGVVKGIERLEEICNNYDDDGTSGDNQPFLPTTLEHISFMADDIETNIPTALNRVLSGKSELFPNFNSISIISNEELADPFGNIYTLPQLNRLYIDVNSQESFWQTVSWDGICKNANLRYLHWATNQGFAIDLFQSLFQNCSSLQHLYVSAREPHQTPQGFEFKQLLTDVERNTSITYLDISLIDLKFSDQEKMEFSQSLSINHSITHLTTNYSLLYTSMATTSILSQSLQYFKLIKPEQFIIQYDFTEITESILGMIENNTHPNLKFMYITFLCHHENYRYIG